jgi:plastocyanin
MRRRLGINSLGRGRWGRRVRAVLVAAIAALVTGVTPGALADQQISAGQGAATAGFTTKQVTMAQGERLTFQNNDSTARHNVVARMNGPDGKPLFESDTIGGGQSAFVNGSQYLKTGTYDFYCTLHGNMTGTLTVTSEGTPATPPPTSGGGGGGSGGGGGGSGGAGGSGSGSPKTKPKKHKHHKHSRAGKRGHRRHKSA